MSDSQSSCVSVGDSGALLAEPAFSHVGDAEVVQGSRAPQRGEVDEVGIRDAAPDAQGCDLDRGVALTVFD
jgi:hypothetical protein